MSEDCIFCKIVAGEIPSDQLYQDELVTAFRDISPQAPVHLLLVPNRHFNDFGEMGDEQGELMGRIAQVAGQLAAQEGVASDGWRFVTNIGAHGGQEVLHTHFHLLGGRPLGPLLAR
ncbi:MAG: histidine triad nucleotide-binding protein [Caldilineaceae bacterium]|nr:histidine triad nucleotide-binding protein [Caldilineaceae bacterium]MCY4090754.1 histidine triad nucleotide-binding protein [Caldilineaceae bacterium]MCY4118361.1 histidine triad nucleotide-binding protein [Caldilineaceae bacterium]MDE0068315.1 histidine triad nucleotide-binding protein [Caldilineaceae bacterium]MDE0183483.1 histidine triad nucleotide-binding protein [Caldilineaceae bacterium]